jgi:hypothetical protein
MPMKRYKPEQVVTLLRQVEALPAARISGSLVLHLCCLSLDS